MVEFINILDNQLYIGAFHLDLLREKLDSGPLSNYTLTKISSVALKTFSLAVYLHYPSKRCSYIIKKPIVVLGFTGIFVCGTELLERQTSSRRCFFKEIFNYLRVVSGVMFTYDFLKVPFQKSWNPSFWR